AGGGLDRDELAGRRVADEQIVDGDPRRPRRRDARRALTRELAGVAIVGDDGETVTIAQGEGDDVARAEGRPLDGARAAAAAEGRLEDPRPAGLAAEGVDCVELRRRARAAGDGEEGHLVLAAPWGRGRCVV